MLGNIGKAGLVLLIPTTNPMVRDLDLERWRFAQHHQFDGQPDDCFNRTSLHLSFTNYHVPIFKNKASGQQDSSVSILECVISVRDSGEWVADVNILGALGGESSVYKLDQPKRCGHPENLAPTLPIMSVECWNDVLDSPDGNFLVKAHGNWPARLAITAVLANHSKRVKRITICPPSVCWQCLKEPFSHNAYVL